MDKISMGRIVEFFPNGSEHHKLPNGMPSAAAIVTQLFGTSEHINLTAFTSNPEGESPMQFWSIQHKSAIAPNDKETGVGTPYWDWFARV